MLKKDIQNCTDTANHKDNTPSTYMDTQLGNLLPEKFQESAALLQAFCPQMIPLSPPKRRHQEPNS
jgi:hypothetical protein